MSKKVGDLTIEEFKQLIIEILEERDEALFNARRAANFEIWSPKHIDRTIGFNTDEEDVAFIEHETYTVQGDADE